MKRQIWIAAVAMTLVAPFAPAALAGDDHRYGRDDDRHGRYDRDDDDDDRYDRDRRGDRHDDDDDRYDRDRRGGGYVVRYHLHGGSGRVRAKSDDRAERIVDLMRSIGADAHIDGEKTVHYKMRGPGRQIRRSHEDAHRLAQKLEGYGFHARVEHN